MSADSTYQTKIQERQGGALLAIASGGTLDIESGGTISIGGTDRTSTLNRAIADPSTAGTKIIGGQHTTAAAADTVVTGLATVTWVVASLDSDPGDDPEWVSATIGDQAGSPAAGSIIIKTWKNTSGTDPTPTAATTFSKKVNWVAGGT